MAKVLISYSHDSPEHAARILNFANQLRVHGVDANIDQYEPHPPEGWPLWMERQIEQADFVLMIFTETYHRRAKGEEDPGRGRGVVWESMIVRNVLYQAANNNKKFIPVIFDSSDSKFITLTVQGVTHYLIKSFELSDNGYEDLYRRITEQPKVVKPPLGDVVDLKTTPPPPTPVVRIDPPLPSKQTRPGAVDMLQEWVDTEESFAATTRQVSDAVKLWLEKRDFLQAEEAIAASPAQKFALKKQIEEAQHKISELSTQTKSFG